MSREPRAKLGSVALGGLVGIGLAAAHVAGRDSGLELGDWAVALLVVGFVVQPFATLGHELGHAVTALLLGGRPSLIVVGRGPFLRVRAEPTLVLFSVLPTRGVPFAGVCRYDPSGLPWRSIALIALAGPLATLAELVTVVLLGTTLWDVGTLWRLLILWSSALLVSSLVVNLRPAGGTVRPGTDRASRRDGAVARDAYARHRAGAPALSFGMHEIPSSQLAIIE